MPPVRGVGKWKGGWEGRSEGGRVLAIENFNLFNYICYDLQIRDNLLSGQQASDGPDICARVFHL